MVAEHHWHLDVEPIVPSTSALGWRWGIWQAPPSGWRGIAGVILVILRLGRIQEPQIVLCIYLYAH